MEHVREMVTGPIIPTPGAVMECTKLLYEYLGDLIVLDVGGATTDLHSVTVESDQVARLMISPEPKAKRTVEGDLGVYVNRWKVVESIGEEKLREQCREQGFSMEHALETYRAIPKTEEEVKLVELLTREAVVKAAERHAGRLRYIYGPSGRSTVAEGKDLTQVKYIVGTGGALTRLPHREEIMREITRCNESGMLLLPGSTPRSWWITTTLWPRWACCPSGTPRRPPGCWSRAWASPFRSGKRRSRYPSATRSSPGLRPSGSSGKRSCGGTLRSARPWAMI